MKTWQKFLMIMGVGALAGCAGPQPLSYDAQKSFALNVVRAAGMKDIRDHALPQAEYEKLTNGTLYEAAWATSIANAPAPGVSSNAALALGVLSVLFQPKADSARDAIIAWMPISLAPNEEDAAKMLRDILQQAIVKTATDFELSIVDELSTHQYVGFTGATVIRDDSGHCDASTAPKQVPACSTYVSVKNPEKQAAPAFIDNQQSNVYAFGVTPAWRNAIVIKHPEPDTLNTRQFLQVLSKNVPKWVYLYSAPEDRNASERKGSFPVVFHQGQPHLFVVPKR